MGFFIHIFVNLTGKNFHFILKMILSNKQHISFYKIVIMDDLNCFSPWTEIAVDHLFTRDDDIVATGSQKFPRHFVRDFFVYK